MAPRDVEPYNLFRPQLEIEPSDPPGYQNKRDRFGPRIGAQRLGGSVYELPPGQAICPYHYEYDEEWVIVLSGQPTLRTPAGEELLEAGDVRCFPPGPQGAHKLTNGGEQSARVLMLSTLSAPSVAVYPDSDKLGVFHLEGGARILLPRSAQVDYWDGETSG